MAGHLVARPTRCWCTRSTRSPRRRRWPGCCVGPRPGGSATRDSGPDLAWPSLLARLLDGADLERDDTAWVMDRVMSGDATPAQIAAFAVALRAKGRRRPRLPDWSARCSRTPTGSPSTGGRSTSWAPAATGRTPSTSPPWRPWWSRRPGRRWSNTATGPPPASAARPTCSKVWAWQSRLGPEEVSRTVAEVGIGFCFAPVFHPSYRHTAGPRREMGIPTVFNFLGPLTNPAQPVAGAIGCGNAAMAPVMAQVFADRGARRAAVPRRRRTGRTDHHHHVDGLGGPRGRRHRALTRPGEPGHRAVRTRAR